MTDPVNYITGREPADTVGALMHATDFLIPEEPDEPNSPDAGIGTDDSYGADISPPHHAEDGSRSPDSTSSTASEELLPGVPRA